MSQRFRSICFTSYQNEITYDQEKVQYIVFQREICPDTKKEHWQGYCELKSQMRMKAIKKMFNDNTLHIEDRKGSQEQAITYCKKDDTRKSGEEPHEYGEPKKAGRRSDLITFTKNIKELSLNEAIDISPDTYVKFHSGFDKLNTHYIKNKNIDQLKDEMENCILKKWQKVALEKLTGQDDRKITWVVDTVGNRGKSFLSRYLIAKHNAFYSRNGKNADIIHAYEYQEYIIFDFPRSAEEYINYGIIEQFKDGILFSPKYNSHTKIKRGAKIICFSNFHPDETKFSMDRWDIYDISDFVSEVVGNTMPPLLNPLSQKITLDFN